MNLIGLDTEFTDLRKGHGRVLVACFSFPAQGVIVGEEKARALIEYAPPLTSIFCLHNAKADFNALGVYPDCRVFDTLIAAWLLDENEEHGLKYLSDWYLKRSLRDPIIRRDGRPFWKMEDGKTVPLEEAPSDDLKLYCLEDAHATRDLAKLYIPALEREHLLEWYWQVEEPFSRILWKMEQRGIRVDLEAWRREVHNLTHDAAGLEQQVHGLVGYEFNVNSPQQLGNVLFRKKWQTKVKAVVGKYKTGPRKDEDKYGWVLADRKGLGLKPRKRAPGGQPSTDKDALKFHEGNPVVDALLRYRKVEKIREGLASYPEFMLGDRLHGKFNQTGTVTGRLSSSDPNLQNIPVRGELGRRVRALFVPAEGHRLVISDLSQIEYRLLADFSGEESLIQGFIEGQDYHENTARLVFGLPPGSPVTKEQRTAAKNISYAVVYGAGPKKVATMCAQAGHAISTGQAAELMERYYEVLPAVAEWKAHTLAEARRFRYVNTMGGRKRRLPDINAPDQRLRGYAERQAVNSVIQGSAADLIKVAMVRMDAEGVPLLLQVHDEVVAEPPEGEAQECARKVTEAFVETGRSFGLRVPVECDTVIADNWSEKK